ncbi:uncharacterized protein N7477_003398 [Penicillium maclennaniae]|uniref:uncharacterized protein n=1 Tax=Penicillium maclennaniae TaxID=1343394 RepID=UPI002540316C|nr:uncharacterized protein N7477_003398 [Penicillium maclennaniae]KAJ5677765.1 hypothetical protein N7477_003398 [Penicillium maclennaniae]
MTARREGADIFSNAPIRYYASRSTHDETTFTDHFGFTPVSLIRLLWNVLVYLTPSRLVVALDSRMSYSDPSSPRPTQMTFHLKHEAMQRIFGLDNNSFPFFPRSRSLSGFGSALLGNTKDAVPSGLGNWDNSCYQNSIIQGLASLKSFSTFLGQNVNALDDKGSLSTHQALKGIIDLLNSASNYGSKLWIPADLKSMSSWQQQDAQEYFSKVVDQIDIEVQQASKGQTTNMGLKMTGPEENILRDIMQNKTSTDKYEAGPVIEKSSLRNPLEGLLAQRVGCMKCGYTEGLSLIPFNCLTVPLGGKFDYDVRECLDQYMSLEPIEGVECAKCTLIRAHEQLSNLLGSLLEDEGLSDRSQTAGLSDAVRTSAVARLEAVKAALEEGDFTETTLANKCHIPSKNRVSTTKSRQAVIARAPQCLAIHVNRSLFDETTGTLKKNLAGVKFPKTMDLNDWCLGTRRAEKSGDAIERWVTNPSESMLPGPGESILSYISVLCPVPDEVLQAEGDKEKPERWYRLSDDDVQMVSEGNVMSQGGAFMLFYEAIDNGLSAQAERTDLESLKCDQVESNSSHTMFEDMSTISTPTDLESSTSRATSVSTPDRVPLPFDNIKSTVPSLKIANALDINKQDSGDALGSPSAITAS